MVRTIGIFGNDSQAVRAVEALEVQGFGAAAVRVIAANSDQAQKVDNETVLPVDRLEHSGENLIPVSPALPFGTAGAAYLVDAPEYGASGMAEGATRPVLGGFFLADEPGAGAKAQLMALGLDDQDSAECFHHIDQGSLLVVVDTDRTGRPYAESALREGGADKIL